MSDTVRLHISIEISTDADVDTGLTVEQWNALTDEQRSAIYKDAWDTEASSNDSGGVSVVTDGAAGI